MNRSSDLAKSVDDVIKLNSWLLYAIFLIIFIEITTTLAVALSPNIKILILHSYHQEYPWTTAENNGFTYAINKQYGSENVIFSTEYLDTKRIEYNLDYQMLYFEYLKARYVSTGNTSATAEDKAREIGISAFALKPIMMSQTAKLIRKVLGEIKN